MMTETNEVAGPTQINWREKSAGIYWSNSLGILAVHVGSIFAFWYYSWDSIALSVFLWWLMGGIGICMGYHRLLTHRSFKCKKWFEYGLTILGATNWECTPIRWVGQHRLHHSETDQEADPHTPHHGFLWSHILWIFWNDPPGLEYARYAKDMQRDPVHVVIDRWSRWFNIIVAGILAGIAVLLDRDPIAWVVWGVCVRSVVIFHATWLVNSLGHYSGYRNYNTGDDSRNNPLVAVLTFGEGWHNNHHADQRSARHGHRAAEIDLTFITLVLLEKVGIVWDVRRPDKAAISKSEARGAVAESAAG
jgi:fatty-acid desaturase